MKFSINLLFLLTYLAFYKERLEVLYFSKYINIINSLPIESKFIVFLNEILRIKRDKVKRIFFLKYFLQLNLFQLFLSNELGWVWRRCRGGFESFYSIVTG